MHAQLVLLGDAIAKLSLIEGVIAAKGVKADEVSGRIGDRGERIRHLFHHAGTTVVPSGNGEYYFDWHLDSTVNDVDQREDPLSPDSYGVEVGAIIGYRGLDQLVLVSYQPKNHQWSTHYSNATHIRRLYDFARALEIPSGHCVVSEERALRIVEGMAAHSKIEVARRPRMVAM